MSHIAFDPSPHLQTFANLHSDAQPLSAPVGWGQPNLTADVLLVQRMVTVIIDNGFLEGQVVLRPIETGAWDDDLDHALTAIQNRYVPETASPLAVHILDNDSPLFLFVLHLAAIIADVARRYPAVVYGLARVMLPSGADNLNFRLYITYILDALARNGLGDMQMVLMAFATLAAETVNVSPISELPSKFNSSAAALRHQKGTHLFDKYDDRSDIGNRGSPDGGSFRGRGFVQLTGRSNYARYERELGWPLEKEPDLANDPSIAAILLAKFLKAHERRIRDALCRNDFSTARRAVNGGIHGLGAFSKALRAGQSFLRRHLVREAIDQATHSVK